jgi:DNA-binding beta-propeller fold protein YncE
MRNEEWQSKSFLIPHSSFLILALLFFGCGSSQNTTSATAPVTAQLARVKFLHTFDHGSTLTVDQFGNIYVGSLGRNTLVKFTPQGDSLTAISGTGSDHYQFNGLFDADARLSTAIFVADSRNHRIEQYTKDLAYVSSLQTRDNTDPAKRFGYPIGVTVDDAGNIYVADAENKRVVKARADYSIERVIGGFTEATNPEAILTRPQKLAVDKEQRLLVLDAGDNSLVEYDNLGNFMCRRSLGPAPSNTDIWPSRRVLTSNDTVFVFSANEVQLLRTPKLEPIARWTIQDSDNRRWKPADMAMRNGLIYLITPEGLAQYGVSSLP